MRCPESACSLTEIYLVDFSRHCLQFQSEFSNVVLFWGGSFASSAVLSSFPFVPPSLPFFFPLSLSLAPSVRCTCCALTWGFEADRQGPLRPRVRHMFRGSDSRSSRRGLFSFSLSSFWNITGKKKKRHKASDLAFHFLFYFQPPVLVF